MRRTGLAEVLIVWGLYGAVAAATVVTYARVPPERLYHVDDTGLAGGLGRALVFLNFPFALAALAVLLIVLDVGSNRLLQAFAAASVVLCLVVAIPGVVDQADLDAKPVNAVPALGVALVLGLTLLAVARAGAGSLGRMRLDRLRLAAAALLVAASTPWILAELGVSVSDVPVLDAVFLGDEPSPEPGDPGLRAVHLGRHHGFDGTLFALAALVLSRAVPVLHSARLRRALALAVAFLLAYGLLNAAQDFWLEQVVKRGWTDERLPSFLRPSLTPAWAVLLASAAAVYWLGTRRLESTGDEAGDRA
ncbi:MAG: hypothetical protein ABR583_11340 [Gaiellaceae bacterium]